jgi:TPR repeat protein
MIQSPTRVTIRAATLLLDRGTSCSGSIRTATDLPTYRTASSGRANCSQRPGGKDGQQHLPWRCRWLTGIKTTNFYLDAIKQLPNRKLQRRARAMCEEKEGLLTGDGRRRSILTKELSDRFKVDTGSLTLLEEVRLLRGESRHGSSYYEISHDRIAEAIHHGRQWRMSKEVKWTVRILLVMLLGLGGLLIQEKVLDTAYRDLNAKKYGEALPLLQLGAFFGNAGGMNNLGWMYQNGNGVKPDYAKARELLHRAADAGESHAMDNLGYLFQYGQGVSPNWVQAEKWYQKAADLGNDSAMNHLGVIYQNGGPGVPQNCYKAEAWFEQAARLGNPWAKFGLGLMHENGWGGFNTDVNQAREYYKQAAAAGIENAVQALVRLGSQANSDTQGSNSEDSPVPPLTTPTATPSL